MKNNITKKDSQNILAAFNSFITGLGLNDVKTSLNSKTGVATITGNKDGIQYTTTLTKYIDGIVNITSEFKINVGKDVLTSQVKELKKQGFKQTEIANMLNVSQSTVSNYLKKK